MISLIVEVLKYYIIYQNRNDVHYAYNARLVSDLNDVMTVRTKKAVDRRSLMYLSILLYSQISVEVRTGSVKENDKQNSKNCKLKNKPKQLNVIFLPF